MLKARIFRWPGEDALHRLQELGRPGAQDEVVIAALRAAQAVLVRGEEKGRESCLDWMQQCARKGEGEVGVLCTFYCSQSFRAGQSGGKGCCSCSGVGDQANES